MGTKRRSFLIGGAALIGGGIFALQYGDYAGRRDGLALTKRDKAGSFSGWLRIGEDDRVTLYTPHVDIGTGSATALAQMAGEELDADWDKITVEQAPIADGFANSWLAKGFVREISKGGAALSLIPHSVYSAMARNLVGQITGGSSATRFTGQLGMRILGSATRQALLEEAAVRLSVPMNELTTAKGVVTHQKSGKSLRYGELAAAAAGRRLNPSPPLKQAGAFALIGKSIPRSDIPAKVDGSAKYGIDFSLPQMRVATVMAAPVRGGKLDSVDAAPAMAIKGVEKVVKFDDAVAVIGKGYWAAVQGLRALTPKFSDGGHGSVSSASMFTEQEQQIKTKLSTIDAQGAKLVKASYRAPFLHHMAMEPYALSAHHQNGRLDVWGGMQDPLGSRKAAADAAGLSVDAVTFHPMPLGGTFGRKLPGENAMINQAVRLAMQSPWPVKVIWPREEEVRQGTYRPQTAITLQGAIGDGGKVSVWHSAFAQAKQFEAGMPPLYAFPEIERNHIEHQSNILVASWRSVEASQHGFFHESFMDEMAQAAGLDPVDFRKRNLAPGSRAAKVLDAAAKASGWGTPLPEGTGRGIAVTECFGTVCAHVVQASLRNDGYPRVEKVWAAVDCGQVVNPMNAEAQVMGGIVMGLSAAIHEEITVEKGAVTQSSFTDYPLLTLAETPEINIEFLPSDAPMGGLGEPGLPPAAPALANALFAATGKRVRTLPIKDQAKA